MENVFFDLPVKNVEETYEKIIEMRNNNDYTTGNLLDFVYYKKNYKLIATDLSKQIELKDPQQINFIGFLTTRGATIFFIIEKPEKTTLNFSKNCKFAKWFWQWKLKICNKKWYVIESELKGNYSHHDPIKFLTKSIESRRCDYSDAYILVTGNNTLTKTIDVPAGSPAGTQPQRKQPLDAATQVVFKNCAPFEKCSTEIDGTLVDEANFINITMPMYNWIECSGNYSDTSGSLWGFKRDEINSNADVNNDDNAPWFKYKASLTTNTEANGTKKE